MRVRILSAILALSFLGMASASTSHAVGSRRQCENAFAKQQGVDAVTAIFGGLIQKPQDTHLVRDEVRLKVIEIRKNSKLKDRAQNLLAFAKGRITDLTVKEVLFISAQMGPLKALSIEGARFLIKSTVERDYGVSQARGELAGAFSLEHARTLSHREMIQIANLAPSEIIQGLILVMYLDLHMDKLEVDHVIELARAAWNPGMQERIIALFSKSQKSRIKPQDSLALADASDSKDTRSLIVRGAAERIARSDAPEVDIESVIDLASSAADENEQDAILKNIMTQKARQISVQGAMRMAAATGSGKAQDIVAFLYLERRIALLQRWEDLDLEPYQAIDLAEAASSKEMNDHILIMYLVAPDIAERISVDEVVSLAEAAQDQKGIGERILMYFASTQAKRLRVRELKRLKDLVRDESNKKSIQMIIDLRD